MIVRPAAGLPLARLRSRSLEVIGRREGFPAKALARPIVLAWFASDMVDFFTRKPVKIRAKGKPLCVCVVAPL